MEIPDEMLKEIRDSGYDQELVYTQIRKLLDSDKPIKEKKLPLKIDKYNWIQIIEGNLLLKSKDSNSNIFLESGDGLGFEIDYFDDVSIDTEKDLDFLLFSMPSL